MADLTNKAIKKGYPLTTINDFRHTYAGGVSSQAINYAIDKDLVDYITIGPRVRAIVLTKKSLTYQPNDSPKRFKASPTRK